MIDNHLKVEGREHLIRDASTGAILSTDRESHRSAFMRRERSLRDSVARRETEKRLANLERSLGEIKGMLANICQKELSE